MSRKIVRGMLTAALWIAALSLVGAIVLDPAGEHDLLPALVVAAGFVALSNERHKGTEQADNKEDVDEIRKNRSDYRLPWDGENHRFGYRGR